MSNTPEIEILLATFNGERYLREQIDSLMAQDYPNLRILARDDGSTDNTMAILKQYAVRFPDRFRVISPGEATSSPKWNFHRLMQASTSDYVCFADQDDVWLPQKMTLTMQAMKWLEEQHGTILPLLAFTDLCVVNEQLETQYESYWKLHHLNPRQANHFARLLGQNVVTGCTAMVNRPLLEMALNIPDEAEMHDSWIALLAAAFGASKAVQTQTILYRQHRNNVLGAAPPPTLLQTPKLRNHNERHKRWKLHERQARGMLRLYRSELSPDKRKILEDFLRCGQSNSTNRLTRICIALRHGFYVPWIRNNLSMLWYLWNLKTANAGTPSNIDSQ